MGIFRSPLFFISATPGQDACVRYASSLVLTSASTGVSNEAQQVGSQITFRGFNRQPTIKVRAGRPLRVLVNMDMMLAPYP